MGLCASQNSEAEFHRQYVIEEDHVLGEGSYAVVYRGRHKPTGEAVAIKRIEKEASVQGAYWEDEIALLRLCAQHPNVLELRHVFQNDQYVYLVTELVEGGELFQTLISEGAYSEWDAKRFIKDILEALAYLHEHNIIHRDIKPENLLLTTKDTKHARIKLGDFGTAKIVNRRSLLGVDHLTWAYCAPEILREMEQYQLRFRSSSSMRTASTTHNTRARASSGAADGAKPEPAEAPADAEWTNASASFKSDIWGVGIVLFVLLSGIHPFDPDGRQTKDQMITNILHGRYSMAEPLWAEISGVAKAFLRLLLQTDPAARPTAAEALKHEWFRRADTPRLALQVSTSDGLGQYQRLMRKKFRTSVLVAIAAQGMLHRLRNSQASSTRGSTAAVEGPSVAELPTNVSGTVGTEAGRNEGSPRRREVDDDEPITMSAISARHSSPRCSATSIIEDIESVAVGKATATVRPADSPPSNSLVRHLSAMSKIFPSKLAEFGASHESSRVPAPANTSGDADDVPAEAPRQESSEGGTDVGAEEPHVIDCS